MLKVGLVALCMLLIACNCVSNAQTDGVNVFDNSVAIDSKLQSEINTLVGLMPAMKPAAPCDECISTLGSIDNIQGKVVQTWYVVCWNGSAYQRLSWRAGQAEQYTPISLEEIPYDAYSYLIHKANVWENPSTITKDEFIDVMTRVRGETYYANNDTLVTRVITSDTGRIGHIEDNTPEVKKYAEGIHYYGPLPTCVRNTSHKSSQQQDH